jgi:hydrogenase maturation protease
MEALWVDIVSRRMQINDQSPQTVVIGLGNILLKDEGIGVHVIRRFDSTARASSRDLMLIDGGTCPDTLSLLPEKITKLIVVDAVQGGGEPGSIYRFTPTDIKFKRGLITSLHQFGLEQGLRMMELLGESPESVIIIGVEPYEIEWGLGISPEMEEIIPRVIELLELEIA